MAMKMAKLNTFPIGIDLGSKVVKMAQLRQSEQGLELAAAGSKELTGDPASFSVRTAQYVESIQSILTSNEFKSRQCVLSLPAEATFVHHVKLPKMAAAQIPAALAAEIEGQLPYPVAQAAIRHIVAGETFSDGQPRQEVIAVASHKDTINACIAIGKQTKLDILAVNIEPCALVECFARLFPQSVTGQPRAILYIDMGAFSTQVVISHGSRVVFARNLAIGGNHLDQAVADSLGISHEQARKMRSDLAKEDATGAAEDELVRMLETHLEEMTGELTQCLRYYESIFRNQPVERLIFLGGQAYDKRLCQAIAQRVNLPAQVGDPLVRVGRAPGAGASAGLHRLDPKPDWAVAVGLSLGAAA